MIATLKFDLDDADDRRAHMRAISATKAYLTLYEIANEIFRPARKHGYNELELDKIINTSECAVEAISLLESKFYEILADNNIDLGDLE